MDDAHLLEHGHIPGVGARRQPRQTTAMANALRHRHPGMAIQRGGNRLLTNDLRPLGLPPSLVRRDADPTVASTCANAGPRQPQPLTVSSPDGCPAGRAVSTSAAPCAAPCSGGRRVNFGNTVTIQRPFTEVFAIGRMVIVATKDTEVIYNPDTYVRSVPYGALARLRRDSPVVWVPEPPIDPWPGGPGFWAVLRHADVRRVLRSPRLFSSSLGATQIRDPATPADLAYVRWMMLNMDPPEHSRLRALLAKAFTPRAVARLVDRIRQRAGALVDAVAERGEVDFAKEIAADLPLLTLADVFGIPESDRWLMFDWSNRVIGYQDAEYAVSASFDATGATEMGRHAAALRPQPGPDGRMPDPRTRAGMPDLYAYAHELGSWKRRNPGDDVMSILMQQVDAEGGRVSVEEFENLFWLFSVAGNETLRNGLPGGMLALLQHPDQYRRLREDPGLLETAVEEMLRWWTPVMHFRRTATGDVELGGVPIRAGQKVVVWFSSANRDPEVFDEPDRFDVGRRAGEHLAFGHGPHFCLGAHLAREQMRALFAAVLERMDDLELAGEPTRLRSNFQNGLKHLPIRWRRR